MILDHTSPSLDFGPDPGSSGHPFDQPANKTQLPGHCNHFLQGEKHHPSEFRWNVNSIWAWRSVVVACSERQHVYRYRVLYRASYLKISKLLAYHFSSTVEETSSNECNGVQEPSTVSIFCVYDELEDLI